MFNNLSTETVVLKHSKTASAFGDNNVSSQSCEYIQHAACSYY